MVFKVLRWLLEPLISEWRATIIGSAMGIAHLFTFSPLWEPWRVGVVATCVGIAIFFLIQVFKYEIKDQGVHRQARDFLRKLANQALTVSEGSQLMRIMGEATATICASLGEEEAKSFSRYCGLFGEHGNRSVASYLFALSNRPDFGRRTPQTVLPPEKGDTH